MPETPKKRPASKEMEEEKPETSTWSDDQKRREYYYDDAHGYKVYSPDEEEKEDE